MQLHIISSFHYDYLYLQNAEKYFQISFRILDNALELLEKEPDWNFTVEQIIPVEEYLRRFPEKLSLMRRFAAEGRLSFAPGMYVMPDMNMIDVESLYMQAKYGKKFLQETLGADAKCCWIADCWGHHAQLPQILNQCGYAGYFFWRCMRPDFEKNDFRWQGLDGSIITTHWLTTGYSDISFPSDEVILHAAELSFAQGTIEDIRNLLNKSENYKTSKVRLLCNGGDFRMPQPSGIKIVRDLNNNSELSGIHFSTPEKFLSELDIESLPQTSGEFNGAFQGCYSSNILIKQLLYYTREQLLAKETFSALTDNCGVSESEWKQLLRHFFHDTVCGTICDDALNNAVSELQSLRNNSKQKGEYIFNPILRKRHEILYNDNGRHYEVSLAPLQSRNIKEFKELPQLETTNAGGCFKNRFFCCTFDGKGRITSLKTIAGHEIADTSSAAWFGLPVMQLDHGDNWLLYEGPLNGGCYAAARTNNHPDPLYRENNDGLAYRSPVFATVESAEIRRSERECIIIQKGYLLYWRLKVDFTLTISMDDISPLLKFKLEADPQGKYYRMRAAFPTTLKDGAVHHGIPGGIQQRDNCEYPAEGFMHASGNDCGLFLLNRGIPGNNTDANGVMMLSLFRSIAMEYKCPSEGSFNNGVHHTFEYAILPHDGEMYSPYNAAVIENYLRPLQTADTDIAESLIELPPDVKLFAMRKHPQGIFMRIGEVWGKTAQYELPCSYIPADGLEQPIGEITKNTLVFRPFEIKNVILCR